MWTANYMDQAGEVNKGAKRSFILGSSTENFVATFSSSELKEKWLSLFQRYLNLAKEKYQLKSLPLNIITEDIKKCAPSLTVTVTNSVTAKDIINQSLPMLGISGSERDYQLWVSSGKDEAPYPLIGHEHPYDLAQNHLPASVLLPKGPEDSTSPFIVGSPKTQGQFILKPRCPAGQQQERDPGQKRGNIRSSTTSPFRWGPCTNQDNQAQTPPPAKPKQLFGTSLIDLCEDDTLPGPLLDFLRNIPGSIFSPGVYEQWLSVMDEGNEEEKITAFQRLLELLPRANAVLLRHLSGLLHSIRQHSFTNQMTAGNLGVCLTLSIFCLPIPCTSDLRKDLREKFDLAQFLIPNGLKIFGEDITSLCAVTTKKPLRPKPVSVVVL